MLSGPVLRKSSPLSLSAVVVCSTLVTFLLVLAMSSFLGGGVSVDSNADNEKIKMYFDWNAEEEVKERQRVRRPPESVAKPKAVKLPKAKITAPAADISSLKGMAGSFKPTIDIGVNIGVAGEGEYLPIIRVAPMYPRRALQRNIEGYVIVEFDVNKEGVVENAKVFQAEPKDVFDSSAVAAVLKFKYKPRVINGEAQYVKGVKTKIRFNLRGGD